MSTSKSRYLRDLIPTAFNMRRELYEQWVTRVPRRGERTIVLNLMVQLFLEGKIQLSMTPAPDTTIIKN